MIHIEDKKTPLYEAHKGLNAKIVPFHGWLLPIQYTSIIEEHNAARTKAGLFDISHLGKIEITGNSAKTFLQKIFTNNLEKAPPGRITYSPICNEEGGILDDVFIYNIEAGRYILIVNAATFDSDLAWMRSHNAEGVAIQDINDSLGGIAIQGPASRQILSKICAADLSGLKHRHFIETKVCGFYALLSRSGYTGEDGFEMFVPAGKSVAIWNEILKEGKKYGLVPAGLGARDTLRLEAGCPLYGVDADESRTPLEAKLEWAVDLSKDFIGRTAMLKRKTERIREVLIGFKMIGRAIARTGYKIEKAGKKIGVVTSGTYSPTLKENIGFAYVTPENSGIANKLDIIIHGEKRQAEVCSVPFYRRKK